MPLSDHVDSLRRRSDGGKITGLTSTSEADGGGGRRNGKRAGRRGISVDPSGASTSILSPLFNHLSSLSTIPSLKTLLPTSPPATGLPSGSRKYVEGTKASWENIDLLDGNGSCPVMLVTSRTYPLQIFKLPFSRIPDDPHVQEVLSAPEEIFSLPEIRYAENVRKMVVPGAIAVKKGSGAEEVVAARLLGTTGGSSELRVGLLVLTRTRRNPTSMALLIVGLESGLVTHRVELGAGSGGVIASSRIAIVVAISNTPSSIHVLHPISLEPVITSLTDLPSIATPPVFSLSGRLLAFATSEASHSPGPDALGSIVTFQTSQRHVKATRSVSGGSATSSHDASQTALLSSAVGIGNGVARGVWAGLKMGARAAGRAGGGRLARSAPADGRSLEEDIEESGNQSDEEISIRLENADVGGNKTSGGVWIKIIDILPRNASTSSLARQPEVIAHFRLPPTRSLASPLPAQHRSQPGSGSTTRGPLDTHNLPVSHLCFSPDGTQLFAAPSDGRAFHILELHPAGARKLELNGDCKGEVWHKYELRRGHTAATVFEVCWDPNGRWLGVGTGRGTVHLFPIMPSGGPPSPTTHASNKIGNPLQLYPLSTVVSPLARLRPSYRSQENHQTNSAPLDQSSPAVFAFLRYQAHPFMTGTFCQDLAIYRPFLGFIEVTRVSVHASREVAAGASGTGKEKTEKRGSGLTEMMKERAGLMREHQLAVEHVSKARWILPLGPEGEMDPPILTLGNSTAPARRHERGKGAHRMRSLAQAEIQTYCTNNRILPSSIYLSKQVDFYAFRQTDEYTPLSVLDVSSRLHRLVFRHEVQARPSPDILTSNPYDEASSSPSTSFDEPLLSALHSVIESRPRAQQIPGLPNGYPRSKWSSLPIRHVAQGLGEGVDRVRREYARAQYSRIKRRASEAASVVGGSRLSFEEDVIFPPASEDSRSNSNSIGEGDEDTSSPSSEVLPTTITEPSVGGDEGNREEGWEVGWEEEYRRAVEDDGGPDDLVLGLLDEEEEERRGWKVKQKVAQRELDVLHTGGRKRGYG